MILMIFEKLWLRLRSRVKVKLRGALGALVYSFSWGYCPRSQNWCFTFEKLYQ